MSELPDLTPLMAAALKGQVDAIAALLKSGADPKVRLPNGFDALLFAAAEGHLEVARALLDAGADPNARTTTGEDAVWFAADKGRSELVELLLARGGAVDATSEKGSSALHLAGFVGDATSLRALITAGADIHARMKDGGDVLMCAAHGGSPECVEALLAAGADPKWIAASGANALMQAAMRGHAEVVRRLLAAGADASHATADGRTAWQLALQFPAVQALLPAPPPMNLDALSTRLKTGVDRAAWTEATAWLAENGPTDQRMLEAALAGLRALPSYENRSAIAFLSAWGFSSDAGAASLSSALSETFRARIAAGDLTGLAESLRRMRELFAGQRVVDRETGAKSRRKLVVPEALLDGWMEWTAETAPGHCLQPWTDVLTQLDLTVAQKERLGRCVIRGVETAFRQKDPRKRSDPDILFPHGVTLSTLLPSSEAVPALVDLLCAGLRHLEAPWPGGSPERFQPSWADGVPRMVGLSMPGNPRNIPGYGLSEAAWAQLRGVAGAASEIVAALDAAALTPVAAGVLGFLIREVASKDAIEAESLKASPVGHAVIRFVHAQIPTDPALHGFRLLGVRMGALPTSAVPEGAIKVLPAALPTTLAEVAALATYLEVAPDPKSRVETEEMVATLLDVVRAHAGNPPLEAMRSRHQAALEEWVAIHRKRSGENATVPRYYTDARPFFPETGWVCLGRNSCTDYWFVDPRARTPEGSCPVLQYLHEVAFACDVSASSLPAFLGYQVVRIWAEREGAPDAIAHLTPPKVTGVAVGGTGDHAPESLSQ